MARGRALWRRSLGLLLTVCGATAGADSVPPAPPAAPAAPAVPAAPPAPATAAEERELVRTVLGDVGRIVAPEGVDTGRYVTLGGFQQWISIRGQDRRAPVLLFLHGGPGDPIVPLVWAYQRPWEDYFTVVHWDQRGFGRSWGRPEESEALVRSITRERYVADTIELIEWLRQEFRQRRIVLVGQSWGTVLALEVAHRRPDLLHVVVTQGLAANWLASVDLLREELIRRAEKAGDVKEAQRLRDVGPVPSPERPDDVLAYARRFARGFPDENTWHNIRGPADGWGRREEVLRSISPDTTAALLEEQAARMTRDPAAFMARAQQAMKAALAWDARRDVGTRFEVPLVVMQGAHDWQTNVNLARAYFDEVCAPWKKWVEFPHAAHALNIEQPGLSVVTLVNDVLPAVDGRVPAGAVPCRATAVQQ